MWRAILRATVPAALVDRTPALMVYAERLRQAREALATRGAAAPERLALFTAADLAAAQAGPPGAQCRRLPRGCCCAGPPCSSPGSTLCCCVWRVAGREGDVLLLSAAHLLTALGLAALVSRADPLRDRLLFVRYVEGVVIGPRLPGALVDPRPAPERLAAAALSVARGGVPAVAGADPRSATGRERAARRSISARCSRSKPSVCCSRSFSRATSRAAWELLRQLQRDGAAAGARAGLAAACRASITCCRSSAAWGWRCSSSSCRGISGPRCCCRCVFLALLRGRARRRRLAAAAGVALLVAGFYVGYWLRHLRARWPPASRCGRRRGTTPCAAAIRSRRRCGRSPTGGVFGTGFGLGDTRYLPAGHTDLALAAVGEELGSSASLAVGVAYAAIMAWRGFRDRPHARRPTTASSWPSR